MNILCILIQTSNMNNIKIESSINTKKQNVSTKDETCSSEFKVICAALTLACGVVATMLIYFGYISYIKDKNTIAEINEYNSKIMNGTCSNRLVQFSMYVSCKTVMLDTSCKPYYTLEHCSPNMEQEARNNANLTDFNASYEKICQGTYGCCRYSPKRGCIVVNYAPKEKHTCGLESRCTYQKSPDNFTTYIGFYETQFMKNCTQRNISDSPCSYFNNSGIISDINTIEYKRKRADINESFGMLVAGIVLMSIAVLSGLCCIFKICVDCFANK